MSNPDIYKPAVVRRVARHAIRGVDYEVSLWGERGNPVLFWLHGWGDASATFQFSVDRLLRDWFVVAPDFRGFGGSKTDQRAFWFPDYLADLDELLNIYSPDEAVRLVGHSMGGNVGGLFAGAFPERVRAFVNVEGFGLADSDPAEAPARYRLWIESGRQPEAFLTYPDFTSLARRIKMRSPRITDDCAEFVARCWAFEQDGIVKLHANARHKLTNAVLYRRSESEACWRNVTAPVLLVAGRESVFLKADDSRLATGSLGLPFPDAVTVIVDNAGHMVHFEAPGELARHLEAFLAKTL